MLGHFLNLNKIESKRLSYHIRQYFIHKRTQRTKQMFKLRNCTHFMLKMNSFQMLCLLQVSKYLGRGHVYHGVASLLFKTV